MFDTTRKSQTGDTSYEGGLSKLGEEGGRRARYWFEKGQSLKGRRLACQQEGRFPKTVLT